MINSEFEENVKLQMFVKIEYYDELIKKLIDITNGKIQTDTDNIILFEDFAGI